MTRICGVEQFARPSLWMVIIGGLGSGCQSAAPDLTESRPPIVDTWVQVFPSANAMDTIRFLADGTLEGATDRLMAPGMRRPPVHWSLGTPIMPDGLCVDADSADARRAHWYCRGYGLVGDTLWLAGGDQLTYLRLAATNGTTLRAWRSPHGEVASKRLVGN